MSVKNNPFPYSSDNKRYHTWNYYLRNKFNEKVCKVPLNTNLSCPNRDGKVGYGGCSFCGKLGAGEQIQAFHQPLSIQYAENKKMMLKKWPDAKTMAYFQAFTNTYCDLATLQSIVQPFYEREDVVALSIATRADCLEDDKIKYLASLAEHKEVWIELGLQSVYDESATRILRGHDYACFLDCINRLEHTKLKICVHLMNSLPQETQTMMIHSAKAVGALPIHAMKIHMLYISKNTRIAQQYNNQEFQLLSFDEYIDTVIKQLEQIPAHIVVQRLTGDAYKEDLIAPSWSLNKTNILNAIDKEMKRRDTYQGKYAK